MKKIALSAMVIAVVAAPSLLYSAPQCTYDSTNQAIKCLADASEMVGSSSRLENSSSFIACEQENGVSIPSTGEAGVYYAYAGPSYADALKEVTIQVTTGNGTHACTFDNTITGNCLFSGGFQFLAFKASDGSDIAPNVPLVIVLQTDK